VPKRIEASKSKVDKDLEAARATLEQKKADLQSLDDQIASIRAEVCC